MHPHAQTHRYAHKRIGAQTRARAHTGTPHTDTPEGPVPADGDGLKILPGSGLSHFESRRPVPLA
jgi:hypothetical protein